MAHIKRKGTFFMKEENLIIRILKRKFKKSIEAKPRKLTSEELEKYVKDCEMSVYREMIGMNGLERQDTTNNILWFTGEAG